MPISRLTWGRCEHLNDTSYLARSISDISFSCLQSPTKTLEFADDNFFDDGFDPNSPTTNPTTKSPTQSPAKIVCDELLVNGDFETGDFTGWTDNDSGGLLSPQGQLAPACNTVINDGTINPPGNGDATAPIQGSFDALTTQDAKAICSLSQTVPIPSGTIVSATLSWQDRIRNYAAFVDPNQEARVMVNINDGVGLQEIWSTNPGDNRFQGLDTPNVESYDVTSFVQSAQAQGNPITVQLDEQNSIFFFNVNWDVVSLEVCSTV